METQRTVNRQPERGPITTHTINLKRKHTGNTAEADKQDGDKNTRLDTRLGGRNAQG